jgi:hypothetical protein
VVRRDALLDLLVGHVGGGAVGEKGHCRGIEATG